MSNQIEDNFQSGKLQAYAKEHRDELIACEKIPTPKSTQEAIEFRQFWIPIFYKLGRTELASELGESTFKYLFPDWHARMQAKLDELLGKQGIQEVVDLFTVEHSDIQRVYHRTKSIHSIWKNVGSIEAFEAMNQHEFAEKISDYLAFRWNMNIRDNENRYDALVRGLQRLPLDQVIKFRNQQETQRSGFDCEPLMKCLFQFNNLPVEVQLLGGDVENYLCAKGYSNYKTGLNFQPQKSELSETHWNARLGMCLKLSKPEFEVLMMRELFGEKITYDASQVFVLDEQPSQLENREWLSNLCL